MNQELPAAAQQAFRLLSSLPPPTEVITSATHSPCVACGRSKYITDFKIYNSGVVNNLMEPLCKLCIGTYKECSKVVCCKCKMVMGWLDPHKDKDGFVFEKNHSYHIQACPNCTPGLLKADLIEKIIYLQRKQKGLI
jgi:hypothetical protein